MKPGDLILVRDSDVISDIIEDISNSPYSHTAGLVNDQQIIEAVGFQKIGYQSLEHYRGKADIFTCDGLSDKQRETILKVASSKIGGHYDYFLLVWEVIRYTFGLLLPYEEGNMIRICSTLWADAYRKAGVDLCPGVKYPSPGDLAVSKLLRKIGWLY